MTPSDLYGARKMLEMLNTQRNGVITQLSTACSAEPAIVNKLKGQAPLIQALGYSDELTRRLQSHLNTLTEAIEKAPHNDDLALPNVRAALGLRAE